MNAASSAIVALIVGVAFYAGLTIGNYAPLNGPRPMVVQMATPSSKSTPSGGHHSSGSNYNFSGSNRYTNNSSNTATNGSSLGSDNSSQPAPEDGTYDDNYSRQALGCPGSLDPLTFALTLAMLGESSAQHSVHRSHKRR